MPQRTGGSPSSAERVKFIVPHIACTVGSYAGIWAHSMNPDLRGANEPALDPGDIEEGINAAAAVGDDRIQEQAGVDVNPETWTHGSSELRVEWFRTGFESGDPDSCDTSGVEV